MAHPVRGTALPVLLVVLWASSAAAQVSPFPSNVRAPRVPVARTASGPVETDDLALEGPVDPQTYLVGPGDVFVVSVGASGGGALARQTTTVVTADGLLVVPEAGTFEAAGRPLADVRRQARAALDRLYRNVPTDVSLAVPRRFSVHVSGAVPLPGRHALSAVGRVEDALARATGDTAPRRLADYQAPPRFEVERRPALRNVVVTGRGGTERRVDLMRYFATGDVAYNPTLDDGDAVYLPTFDPTREGVSVGGAVDRPGFYDWRPGDTAAALVEVAAGTGLGLRVARVRRTRTVGGRTESVEVPLGEAGGLGVEPRDQVYAVAPDAGAGFAGAIGAVAFPGSYPIQQGRTTLADLVEAAGGLAPDALVRAAYVERAARSEPQAALDVLALPSDQTLTIATLDSTVTGLGRLSELGLVGRRYYVQEYVSTPRLSVDVQAALDGGASVVLEPGDRLVVPRDLGVVRVFGQVGAPGYVPYQDGLTARAYVDRAGGPGPAATTIYTVDARTGRFSAGPDVPVRPGDAVFMDRPPTSDSPAFEGLALQERRAAQDASRDRRQFLLQTVSTTIATLGFLISTYFLIRQNTGD